MKTSTSPLDRIRFAVLVFLDLFMKMMFVRFQTFVWWFARVSARYLAWAGRTRARRAALRALETVPAYERFVASQDGTWAGFPETDKASYVEQYPPESRCKGGRIPHTKIVIDESSGSTGTPFNWIRCKKEREQSHAFISYFVRYCYGNEPWITINGFSMGAWATGFNMGIALEKNSVVKNTGPDIDKILSTLEYFGPDRNYLILGYPPFLKHLIDEADKRGFALDRYRLRALVGGEGMSEGLRDYLATRFEQVCSGYGVTDLEIGMAGETPIAIAIRKLANRDPEIREKLFGKDSRLPMVFQYNPLMHHIDVNEAGELVFTISRPSLLAPRIRYNPHDQGGVARFDEMADLLAREGIELEDLVGDADTPLLHIPFMWIYGRKDFTVSVMGANIYPEDLEQCVYSSPELAPITRSFCQALHESADGSVRPHFLFEIDAEPTEELRAEFRDQMVGRLVELNADYREAYKEYPETLVPRIDLFRCGEGPFAANQGKIKQIRLLGQREEPARLEETCAA